MSPRIHPAWPMAALAAFLVLLALTVGGWAPLRAFDTAVSEAFRGYVGQRPDLVEVLRVATDVATTWAYLLAGALAALLLRWRGARREALFCAAVAAAVPVLWGTMHWLLHRPRPVAGFVVVDSNGFPSGHTMNAAAAALVAGWLLWPRLRPPGRLALVLLAGAFAVAVGVSRLALLAHWPVDVLGGWLLAIAVVPPLAHLSLARPHPPSRPRSGDHAVVAPDVAQ